jgi:hypothetical protein
MSLKMLKLQGGERALVDADVYEWAQRWQWKLSDWGYVIRAGNNRSLHRMVLGLEPGDKRQGDHKNGNKLDCRRSNLRIVTYAQNRQNERARRTYGGKPPASKHRGVFRRSEAYMAKRANGKPWYVKHKFEGKEHLGGHYATEEEANQVAIEWRKQHMPFSTN